MNVEGPTAISEPSISCLTSGLQPLVEFLPFEYRGRDVGYHGRDRVLFSTNLSFLLEDSRHMVLDGYVAPTQELNGAIIPWPRKDWTKDQVLANALNRKAICVIISSLCREEQGRVQHCTTAHDMWKILENYHEGTVQVKNKKVELLIGEYEGFKNKPNETVTETTNRLFGITTNLKKLGKHYTLGEINGKILRSLPLLDWQPKITAIEESHDIRNLRTDELIGNLLLHEMTYMKEI
ncbi:uncharacterized protein LOC126681952 [Mercurialis annua]|uniref:uncharacterized protein LOC126681952 n=1 Tax=Mercurialis annua TaxID=3986 RepID=UPI00215F98C5|nr:uncharacterized protein LOC126681952 [Mercurialis annua]